MISFLVFRTIPNEVFQFIPADEFDIEEDIQSCDDVEDYCLDPWIGIIIFNVSNCTLGTDQFSVVLQSFQANTFVLNVHCPLSMVKDEQFAHKVVKYFCIIKIKGEELCCCPIFHFPLNFILYHLLLGVIVLICRYHTIKNIKI